MNLLDIEVESAYRRQTLLHEAQNARLLGEHTGWQFEFPGRILLFIAAILIALGTRWINWIGSAASPGYSPNLHMD